MDRSEDEKAGLALQVQDITGKDATSCRLALEQCDFDINTAVTILLAQEDIGSDHVQYEPPRPPISQQSTTDPYAAMTRDIMRFATGGMEGLVQGLQGGQPVRQPHRQQHRPREGIASNLPSNNTSYRRPPPVNHQPPTANDNRHPGSVYGSISEAGAPRPGESDEYDLQRAMEASIRDAAVIPTAQLAASAAQDSPDNEYYTFLITAGDDSFDIVIPESSTVGQLRQMVADRAQKRLTSIQLLGWPTGRDPVDTTLLRSATSQSTGAEIPLLMIMEDEDDDDDNMNEDEDNVADVTTHEMADMVLDDELHLSDADSDEPTMRFANDRMMTPGSNDPSEFGRSFIRRYGRDPLVEFFPGTLTDALLYATRDFKPVLVYLHSDTVFCTNIFCSTVLASPAVATLLEHRFVVWGWDMTQSSQREQFRRQSRDIFTPPSVRPYMAVLVRIGSETTVLKEFYGHTPAERLLDDLMASLPMVDDMYLPQRAVVAESEARRLVKVEQDRAFQESLLADRMKAEALEREKMEEEARLAKEKADEMRAQEEEEMRLQRLQSKIPDEPDKDAKQVVTVQLRYPSGEKGNRRFLPSHTIENVVAYVSGKGYPAAKYQLAQTHPKVVLSNLPGGTTLEEAGLHRRVVLIVEERSND